MIDDSLKVLISLLHLVHHSFELVRSGTDGIGVTLTALIKVIHFVCSEVIDIYKCKFNKDQNDVRVITILCSHLFLHKIIQDRIEQ